MNYPKFFDAVPTITLYDPLAEFLGAVEGGLIEYRYLDAVRLAGHSCPTVASAYWATHLALASLYPGATPLRGDIRVDFAEEAASGVTGVMANVASMLTGAMGEGGFKGIGGRFERRERLFFAEQITGEMRFTRLDSGQAVQVNINLQSVPASPRLPRLMAGCLANSATPEEVAEFRQLWQERVRTLLLEHGNDPEVFMVRPV